MTTDRKTVGHTKPNLFVTRKWPPALGGMETYSYELTEALSRQSNTVVVALAGKQNGHPPSIGSLLFFFLKTAFYLLRHGKQYSVIHFGDFVLLPLALWLKLINKESKTIVTVHGLDVLYANRRGFLPRIYKLWIKAAAKLKPFDRIITNSSNTAKIVREYDLGDSHTIPLAINPSAFKFHDKPSRNHSILFQGRLVRRKGLSWFIKEVFPALPEHITLKIVGPAWDESELKALEHSPRLTYLGRVDDQELTKLRNECQMFIMPNQLSTDQTDVEGFGLVAVENAYFGMPVLASNIEGITDAIVDGKTGFLLPSTSPDVWIKKICEIDNWNTQQRLDFASTARQCIQRRYTWDIVAANTLNIYQSLTGKQNET